MIKKSLLIIGLISFLNANSYQEWLDSQNSQYTQYKKSMDEEFSDMLKKDWEAFKAMSTPSPYIKPKPIVMPKIKQEIVVPKKDIKTSPKVITKPIKIVKIPKVKIIIPLKKIINEDVVKKEIIKEEIKPKIDETIKTTNINFYSQNIEIKYDKKMSFNISSIDKNTISSFWDSISKTKFQKVVNQVNKKSKELNLNDWAKYQFVNKLGYSIYQNNNSANLFTWFILTKMGYDTKVGYNKHRIYLLSTIKHSLYQVSFFNLNNKKYYILTPNGRVGNIGSVFTYKGNYPKASKKLSFYMDGNIKFYTNLKQKDLRFKYFGKQYTINTKYSLDLIDFYKTFPQSDYRIYFGKDNSISLSNSILSQLQPLINGKSEIEAVNLLLRFVQTSFEYKTDQKQFSYEKVMFPEETVFYKYSDCEDRSIMFSYLVKNLLNLDVVGVKYKDHLATAIAFSSNISGDGFNFRNKKYTISDPTYINANAGMAMPKYKNSKFKVIVN